MVSFRCLLPSGHMIKVYIQPVLKYASMKGSTVTYSRRGKFAVTKRLTFCKMDLGFVVVVVVEPQVSRVKSQNVKIREFRVDSYRY